jgi:hypothetical protein
VDGRRQGGGDGRGDHGLERKAAVIGRESPPGDAHLFRADITELVVTGLGDPPDHLVIESWHEGRGVTRRERR